LNSNSPAKAGKEAREILERRRGDLDAGAAMLLDQETITSDDFAPLKPVPEIAPAPVQTG
jgi:cell division protease FtsH